MKKLEYTNPKCVDLLEQLTLVKDQITTTQATLEEPPQTIDNDIQEAAKLIHYSIPILIEQKKKREILEEGLARLELIQRELRGLLDLATVVYDVAEFESWAVQKANCNKLFRHFHHTEWMRSPILNCHKPLQSDTISLLAKLIKSFGGCAGVRWLKRRREDGHWLFCTHIETPLFFVWEGESGQQYVVGYLNP